MTSDPPRPSPGSLFTEHRLVLSGDARILSGLADESVDLIVTSPPYPMVAMWDDCFRRMAPETGDLLASGDAKGAFEAMHGQLDRVWATCFRVLRPGGFACVNIGDATRTLDGVFRLHPNHARALRGLIRAGFTPLPDILWRKPNNSPTKFLGSGMLPGGAYVTYEHEYILILRKGDRRRYRSAEEKTRRRQSAYFWEERNVWFSDLWSGILGTGQELPAEAARRRSAAFPLEIPYRLIAMYSLYGETVLDPFCGTGTTLAAALALGRNGIGVDRDDSLRPTIETTLEKSVRLGRERARDRLADHLAFVRKRLDAGKEPKHTNETYGCPVITKQERDLILYEPSGFEAVGANRFRATHQPVPWPTTAPTTS